MARISNHKALTLAGLTYATLAYPIAHAAELVFVPLDTPCRLINTRSPLPGSPFTDDGNRQDFLAWSDGNNDLSAQGGDNCVLPRAGAKPNAIAANVTAIAKSFHAKGNLLAYPFTGADTTSGASLINFSDGNIANASIIAISPDQQDAHFSITANVLNTTGAAGSELKMHVAVDVTGYFYESTVTDLKNVVTVSQQGTGFTDPIAAMNSITDASSTNPYLLDIGSGDYNLSQALEMKEYVTIKGAGIDQTILQGKPGGIVGLDADLQNGVMIGADNAVVTNLTLSNVQGTDFDGSFRRGIINKSVSPTIKNVKIDVKGLQQCAGIVNENPTTKPVITEVEINVNCDNTSYGIFNFLDAAPTLSYLNVTVSGGVELSDGIHNTSGQNSTVVRHSTIRGEKAGIRSRGGSKSTISFSQIFGGLVDNDNDGSENRCGHSINGDTGTSLDTQCL